MLKNLYFLNSKILDRLTYKILKISSFKILSEIFSLSFILTFLFYNFSDLLALLCIIGGSFYILVVTILNFYLSKRLLYKSEWYGK